MINGPQTGHGGADVPESAAVDHLCGGYAAGVIGILATGLVVVGLVFAGGSFLTGLLNRIPGIVLVGAAALLELVLIGQLIAAVVLMLSGERPAELATFLAYLIVSVLVLPVAVLWAASERNRWSSIVLGVAGLVLVVLVVRLQQVWSGA
jgi:hypothetical protein